MRVFISCFFLCVVSFFAAADTVYLSSSRAGHSLQAAKTTPVMKTALRVLSEEIEKRTGSDSTDLSSGDEKVRKICLKHNPSLPAESYKITLSPEELIISGHDGRAMIFGVGHVLSHSHYGKNIVQYCGGAVTLATPAYPMRGHQLGYRYNANSYDSWDDRQYEQYIRELALFGTNSIENIPFQDEIPSPHMPLDRRTMNRRMSEICADYGLDYWIWTPAVFDLADLEKRKAHLAEYKELFNDCPELTGVFFPGGDPGANPPELVLPFLKDLVKPLSRTHPEAKIWLSLQWFTAEQCEDIQRWIDREQPKWFGGLVSGPGSPDVPQTRKRLNKAYPVRHYPDITHTVRCQYPIPWWDHAFALTLGREAINPMPHFYGFVHNYYAPMTVGFITYSDGINDDVNKIVWSRRGWDPEAKIQDILTEYASFFFPVGEETLIADGIAALERNWTGDLESNGGVAATLTLWQDLEKRYPRLQDDWRWQSLLVRAYYDALVRERLLHERALEKEANAVLLKASKSGADAAMDQALNIVNAAEVPAGISVLREKVVALYDQLFHSIGLQSSVPKYKSRGYERGCSLDFIDYPLNNRWWLEDQFAEIKALSSEEEKLDRLAEIALWESPGSGSFYDAVGQVGKSPHVKRAEAMNTDPEMERCGNPEAWWWDQGFSRQRLTHQSTLSIPFSMMYEGLERDAEYVLRIIGAGEAFPRANGFALVPSAYSTELGGVKEFPIPNAITTGGTLIIDWTALEEEHINWRQQSRIAEVWLLKKGDPAEKVWQQPDGHDDYLE